MEYNGRMPAMRRAYYVVGLVFMKQGAMASHSEMNVSSYWFVCMSA